MLSKAASVETASPHRDVRFRLGTRTAHELFTTDPNLRAVTLT